MKATDPKKYLRFADVRAVLAASVGSHPAKMKTLEARLQQLQKLGLPRGANVGRAGRARYEYWQLAELSLYMDLLDAGIAPAMLHAHFGAAGPFYALGGVGKLIEGRGPDDPDSFLILHLNALQSLRTADPGRQQPSFADHLIKTRSGSLSLGEAIEDDGPAVLVNLTRGLRRLRAAIEQVLPERATLSF